MTDHAIDIDRYLARIGLTSRPGPDVGGLRALQVAHLHHVPFENLDILAGRPITLEIAALEAKVVGAGRGGFCYELNGLFAALLEAIGFRVTRLAAEVWSRDQGMQTASTLPEHFDGANSGAEIDVHPSGKWLYVSNRGRNTVVLFKVDADEGTLAYVEEQGTGGFTPRHFGIDPSAQYLAVGNQGTDTILVARIDDRTGRLKPSGLFAHAPSPACVKFLQLEGF